MRIRSTSGRRLLGLMVPLISSTAGAVELSQPILYPFARDGESRVAVLAVSQVESPNSEPRSMLYFVPGFCQMEQRDTVEHLPPEKLVPADSRFPSVSVHPSSLSFKQIPSPRGCILISSGALRADQWGHALQMWRDQATQDPVIQANAQLGQNLFQLAALTHLSMIAAVVGGASGVALMATRGGVSGVRGALPYVGLALGALLGAYEAERIWSVRQRAHAFTESLRLLELRNSPVAPGNTPESLRQKNDLKDIPAISADSFLWVLRVWAEVWIRIGQSEWA